MGTLLRKEVDMFVLISNKELNDIENARKFLCKKDYLHNSEITNKLWQIVYKKRTLKWMFNEIKRKILC